MLSSLKHFSKHKVLIDNIKRWLIILLIFLIIFISLDFRIRPIIKNAAQNYAIGFSTREINNSVSKVLSNIEVDYFQLVCIKYDEQDNVRALSTNILNINKLKSEITADIQNEITQHDSQIISIPLGNIIGSDYFMGFGPKIKFTLSISGSVQSELLSSFIDAGINQTKHQIILRVTTNVTALVPWINTSTNVSTDFILAETVIVGDIPESYSYLTATDTPLSDIILNESQ